MPKKTNVHIILDRSGSMQSCRAQTVDAVNEYLRGLGEKTKVSLTLFDTSGIDLIWDKRDPAEIKLTLDEFQPRASTPLYDAIGKTVAKMRAVPTKALTALVIVTDGQENASQEYTKSAIKSLLDDLQKEGWLVLYLGANQDAFAEGGAIGTVSHNTISYDTRNIGATMVAASAATMRYAGSGSAWEAGFTDEERKRAAS